MPSLSDLFVSYKYVNTPKPQPEPTFVEQPAYNGLNIQTAIDRYQQLSSTGEPQPAQILTPNDEDEDNYIPTFNWQDWDEDGNYIGSEQQQTSQPTGNDFSDITISLNNNKSSKRYERGDLEREMNALFKREGINAKVSSFIRKPGQAGVAGDRSNHIHGNALDIVPGNGETFDSIRKKMVNSSAINQFFNENQLGILDETDPVVMQQTHASGKHFHIGPDPGAVKTWSQWTDPNKKQWTQSVYNAFVNGLRSEYGNTYSDSTYNRIAKYITQQAAVESGYGVYGNGFNFGGHMRNGKTVNYGTMDDFVKAQIKTLKKWDFMNSKTLREFVDNLYKGSYRYNAHDTADKYYNSINGTSKRVEAYLARNGGKFAELRNIVKNYRF